METGARITAIQDPQCSSERRLVVLHVAPISDVLVGGPTYSVAHLASSLHEHQVSVALLTTDHRSSFTMVQQYPVFWCRDGAHLRLERLPPPFNHPDLICFHSTYIPFHAWIAYQSKKLGIPYIVTPRGGMTRGSQKRNRWKKVLGNAFFFSHIVRGASAIHCLTSAEAEEARQWGRPVFVVGNGINLPSDQFLARPGMKANLRIIFLGRLDIAHKGLDLLIEGCAQAKEALRKSNAEVHIYGPSFGKSRVILQSMISTHELSSIVQLREPVLGEAKTLAFSSADIFIHPSRHEGHPIAVLEALSHGLPCLLTPGTNIAKEVAQAGAGWEVEATPAGIANGLSVALMRRAELAGKGVMARQLAANSYSWEQVVQQIKRKYSDLIV